MMRQKFFLGIALAVALLGLFLYNTDFAKLREALAQANLLPLLGACLLQASTFSFRASRWRLLLGKRGDAVPWSSLFNIAAIGFMLNNFAPRGSGELARSYLLGKGHGTGISTTFATIVLERLFDFLTVLAILAVLLSFSDLPVVENGPLRGDRLRSLGWLITLGTLGMAGVLALLYARAASVLSLCRRLLKPLPERFSSKILALLATFIEGFSCLTSVRALMGVLFYSALLWLWLALSFVLVLKAFPVQLPASAPWLVLVFSVFSMFVPTPGGVGAMHGAVQFGLLLYGVVNPDMVRAIAIVLHASGYLPVSLTGLLCMRLEGLDFGRLGQATQEAEALEAKP